MKISKDSNILFRLGFGLIFLSNSVQAFVAPDEFTETVSKIPFLSQFVSPELFVQLIGVNDLVLFILILSGKWPRLVALWAGLWVLGIVVAQGVWASETIFHIGVIALALYYARRRQVLA